MESGLGLGGGGTPETRMRASRRGLGRRSRGRRRLRAWRGWGSPRMRPRLAENVVRRNWSNGGGSQAASEPGDRAPGPSPSRRRGNWVSGRSGAGDTRRSEELAVKPGALRRGMGRKAGLSSARPDPRVLQEAGVEGGGGGVAADAEMRGGEGGGGGSFLGHPHWGWGRVFQAPGIPIFKSGVSNLGGMVGKC